MTIIKAEGKVSIEANELNNEESKNQISSGMLDDGLIEELWRDLNGAIALEKIRQVAKEVAEEYEGAPVTTFLPIFIHRRTRERLKSVIDDEGEISTN
jgi:hypothetical protein